MELDQVLILVSVLILIFFFLLILRVKIRFHAINEEYGKPYRAFVIKIVKITGDIPQLTIGKTSLALHPLGAISLDTFVIQYSQIESITIQENTTEDSNDLKVKNKDRKEFFEKDLQENSKKSIRIELTEPTEGNQSYEAQKSTLVFGLTAKDEIQEIENELLRGWRKYHISGH